MKKLIEWLGDIELNITGGLAWFVIVCTGIVVVKAIVNIISLFR